MKPRSDLNDYIKVCRSLEWMAEKYKSIQQSQEYRNGVRVTEYIKMLKKGEIIKIFLRVLKRNSELNSYIDTKAFLFSNKDQDFVLDKRIAVYTALFGQYDKVQKPLFHPDNIDYYIFTDNELPQDCGWKRLDAKKYLPKKEMSNIEKNRFFKMLPHILFADFEFSIYVDANVIIVSDLTPLVNAMSEMPIAMFLHKNRNCVYEEANACIQKNKDKKERLQAHIEYLREHGVPEHSGLLEATVIVRKHHDELCKTLMEQWWEEFEQYSKRDQLSLRNCFWVNHIDIDKVGILGNNLYKCNKFIIANHE